MSFFHQTLSATGGRVLSTGLQFFMMVLVAATLGNEGHGKFAFLILVPMVAWTLLNFGLSHANLYLLGKGRIDPVTLSWGAFLWSLLCGGLVFGAWLIYSSTSQPWQTLRLLQPFQDSPWLLHGSVASIGFLIFYNLIVQSYLARNRLDLFNLFLVGRSGATLILLGLAILFFGNRVEVVFSAWLACLGGWVLVMIYREVICTYGREIQLRLYFRQALSYGAKVFLAGVAFLLMYRLDQFFVMHFCGDVELSRYSWATQVAETLLLITGPMYLLTIPRTARGGDQQANRETPRTFRMVFWALVLLSPLLYVLFRLLLLLLAEFGYEAGEAAIAFVWLLPGVIFLGVDQIISGDLAGRQRQIWNTIVASGMLVVNIALDLWWIPKYGIQGAAAATSIAYVGGCLITLLIFLHFSHATWKDLVILRREDFKLLLGRLRKIYKA